MNEPVIIGDARLYLGDCRECLQVAVRSLDLGSLSIPLADIAAVVSDPPWGSNTACNAQRFTRASSPYWDNVDTSKVTPHVDIVGDDVEFDPRQFIFGPTILWGANWFTRHLDHSGGWLIWDKRKGAERLAEKGWPLGEAELAWTNIRGSTRVFRNLWSGLLRSTEKGEFHHPTQKPVDLMRWCIEQLPEGSGTILDPFMGSGTTGVACAKLGRKFIGIEIEEKYFSIACRRIEEAYRQADLFVQRPDPAPKPALLPGM
jgi:site-specific DNA-methyltransferase (adenine-specific)